MGCIVEFGRTEGKGLFGFEEFQWGGINKKNGKRFVSLVDGLSLVHHNEGRCVDRLNIKETFYRF
jgi:hypothetical protein